MSHRIPNLVHPVQVTVERLVRSELVMDDDAREALHGPRTTPAQTFKVPAQVKWVAQDEAVAMESGVRERSVGYILCRLVDLNALLGPGQRLKRNDRITAMGPLAGLDLYIVKEEPTGHLPLGSMGVVPAEAVSSAGATLVKYWFQDFAPVRQQGDL